MLMNNRMFSGMDSENQCLFKILFVVDFGTRAEEEVCDLEVALVRGHHQRRLPLAARLHQARVVTDQGPHHRDLALLGCGL